VATRQEEKRRPGSLCLLGIRDPRISISISSRLDKICLHTSFAWAKYRYGSWLGQPRRFTPKSGVAGIAFFRILCTISATLRALKTKHVAWASVARREKVCAQPRIIVVRKPNSGRKIRVLFKTMRRLIELLPEIKYDIWPRIHRMCLPKCQKQSGRCRGGNGEISNAMQQ
jgi:hypothetical protein